MNKKIIIVLVIILFLILIGIYFIFRSRNEKQEKVAENNNSFSLNSTVEDVINDEAFEGFGNLIFPVNRNINPHTTLEDVGSAYIWYNNINPNKTVQIVNYLKTEADNGNQIFYDIYTDEEKAEDPEKENTGLFFLRGNPGEKFAIVSAGGGMVYVGAMHDSFPHCLELAKNGYNAFAIIYRPGYETAPEDLARAVAFIHEHAEELEVDVSDYSLWGGSAGARMAAWVGNGTENYGEEAYPRPAAVIMQYTGMTEVTGEEPPTYNCVGTNDGIAPYQTMQERIDRISANGTDTQIEIFEGLPHGFGIGEGTVAEGWVNNAIAFWERNMKKDNEVAKSTMEYTNAIPSSYFNEANNQGRVERIEYQTYDYTQSNRPEITKTAYVYLPYGYDENDKDTKYNVFFFMHGWTGTAEEYLNYNNNLMVNILDNMIQDNLIEPLIVVSLTFDTENRSQNFSRSTDEIAVFHQEFRNELLPFIDANYNTYGTRESRCFGGFSLGAVTTWHEFENNLDLIKYFLPMSGDSWIVQMYGGRSVPEETANRLKEIADSSGYDFNICQTNGTNDAVFSQPDNQMKAMFELTDTFNSSNLNYLMKEGGYHNLDAVMECTYNGLQRMFK